MSVDAAPLDRTARLSLRWLATPTVAVLLGVVSVTLTIASLLLSALAHEAAQQYVWLFPYGVLGAVIAYRQPGNAIGWIMLATSNVTLLCSDAGIYAVAIYHFGHGLPLGRLAVFMESFWIVFVLLLPLPILLFPDGRLPAGRWRLTVWAYGAMCAIVIVDSALIALPVFTDHVFRVDSTGELTAFDGSGSNILGIPILINVLVALSWVVHKGLAYRRSTGERRAQLKWLMTGALITILGFTFGLTTNIKPVFATVLALPICMGVGILKYRLYEIDRMLSRTVSYAILSALLVGVFVGLVALSTDVLAFSSSVGVAASTLAAAALFNPLRVRVQRIVDRRFNRSRYDAEATVAAFAARLRDAVDLDTVAAELLSFVEAAVQPAHATIWIRRRSR